jgi:gluconokinase
VTDTRIHVIIVTGVAGAGKTTTGQALAASLAWPFHDADAFHPVANIEKMSQGHALTDEDRVPWLDALCRLIARIVERGEHAVLACSALKQAYRDVLVPKNAPRGAVRFVYLEVPVEELRRRLQARKHYFKPELLGSQLAALEKPVDALVVDGTCAVGEIVAEVRATLGL